MFTPCSILGAKKRRATVFIPRAAFGGHLRLAWFELTPPPLFFEKIQQQKTQSSISLSSSSSLPAVGLLLLLLDDDKEEEEAAAAAAAAEEEEELPRLASRLLGRMWFILGLAWFSISSFCWASFCCCSATVIFPPRLTGVVIFSASSRGIRCSCVMV